MRAPLTVPRLFSFLLSLVASEFWGQVTVRFKQGKTVGVTVQQDYIEETLPGLTPEQTAKASEGLAAESFEAKGHVPREKTVS